jgi:hypothetical protein
VNISTQRRNSDLSTVRTEGGGGGWVRGRSNVHLVLRDRRRGEGNRWPTQSAADKENANSEDADTYHVSKIPNILILNSLGGFSWLSKIEKRKPKTKLKTHLDLSSVR